MLHRKDPSGLLCITQPTHAWVSAQMARAWGNEHFGSFAPTEEVCVGTEQHDIGWQPWEQFPTLNPKTGYPHSFTELPTAVHVGIWSNAKNLALPIGRYIALLVSLHGTGLYERFTSWQNSPESTQIVQDFLEREYAFQEKLIATLQDDPHYTSYTTPEVIARNRQLVATWDSFSLALCQGFQGQQQIKNVPTAVGETTLTLTVDNNPNQITVSPWPFQQSELTLVYEGRLLQETFTDEQTMRLALVDALWSTITTSLIPT